MFVAKDAPGVCDNEDLSMLAKFNRQIAMSILSQIFMIDVEHSPQRPFYSHGITEILIPAWISNDAQ